jgi:hypothetical protein
MTTKDSQIQELKTLIKEAKETLKLANRELKKK